MAGYKGNKEDLDMASLLVLEMIGIPRLQQRLKGVIMEDECESQYDEYNLRLDRYNNMLNTIMGDANFKQYLKVLLQLGNMYQQKSSPGE